jgi:hypothetical protein
MFRTTFKRSLGAAVVIVLAVAFVAEGQQKATRKKF